jgi:Cu-Zn family superoxide dismutase
VTISSNCAFFRPAGVAATLAVLVAACSMTGSGSARAASATLADASGRQVGVVRISEAGDGGVSLSGDLQGLAAGTHGIHFHAVGSCDAAGAFASAGGHFNPGARKHGLDSPEGPHAGDLPNLVAADGGTASLRASSTRVTLTDGATSLLDADGSALVVHATADDQRTDPSGNSGARIACGVVRADSR